MGELSHVLQTLSRQRGSFFRHEAPDNAGRALFRAAPPGRCAWCRSRSPALSSRHSAVLTVLRISSSCRMPPKPPRTAITLCQWPCDSWSSSLMCPYFVWKFRSNSDGLECPRICSSASPFASTSGSVPNLAILVGQSRRLGSTAARFRHCRLHRIASIVMLQQQNRPHVPLRMQRLG